MRRVRLPAASRAHTLSQCMPSASAAGGLRSSRKRDPSSVTRRAATPVASVMSADSRGRLVCAVDGAWRSIAGAVASTRSVAPARAMLPARSRAVTDRGNAPSASLRLTSKLPSPAARVRATAAPTRTSTCEPASVRPRRRSLLDRSQPLGAPATRRTGGWVSTLIAQLRRISPPKMPAAVASG